MRLILSYLVLFFASATVIESAAAKDIYIRELSEAGQFKDMTVQDILKDRTGYIWFATGKGVERFDGVHVRHYALGTNSEKPVAVMAENPYTGELFAANDYGIWTLSSPDRSFVRMKGVDLSNVLSLAVTGRTRLLAGTTDGLYETDLVKKKAEKIQLAPTRRLGRISVNDIFYDKDNRQAWIATSDGIQLIDLEKDENSKVFECLDSRGQSQQFNRIIKIKENVYLGTPDRGVMKFNVRDHSFSQYVDVGCNVISSLQSEGGKYLYVGSDGGGVAKIDVSNGRIIDVFRRNSGKSSSLHSNSVYALHIDDKGQMWVGYYQTGADYTLYNSGMFSVFNEKWYSTLGTPARTMTIDGDKIVLGTIEGLYIIDRARQEVARIKSPELRSDMVISSGIYNGKYYIGTYGGGLNIIDSKPPYSSSPLTAAEKELAGGHVFSICPDREGTLWIGTSNGVYRFSGDRLVGRYTHANSRLPEGNVYEIFFDSTGKGWICTEKGMAVYDPGTKTLRTDIFPRGFFNRENIRQIYEGRNSTLYFLPYKGPFFISDILLSKFERVNPKSLEGKDIKSVIEDDTGHLWVATSNGMFRWNKRDRWEEYAFIDGIPHPIFNSMRALADSQGNFWFGNSKGLLKLDHEKIGPPENVAFMRINEITVNGKESKALSKSRPSGEIDVILSGHQNNLSISLSAFSYTYSDYIHYEYKMDGVDEDWKSLGKDFLINYYDLPGGKHTLHIRLRGSYKDVATIIVHNPYGWWVWALGIAGIVILGLVVFVIIHNRRARRYMPFRLTEIPLAHTDNDSEDADNSGSDKYKVSNISLKELEEIDTRLEKLMKSGKPYLKPDLRLGDLAEEVSVPAFKLSYYFSQYKMTSYYNYINGFRIEEFKRLAKKSEAGKYTLSAYAEMAGFSSRASFFRYFKKLTGISPAEYLKNLK